MHARCTLNLKDECVTDIHNESKLQISSAETAFFLPAAFTVQLLASPDADIHPAWQEHVKVVFWASIPVHMVLSPHCEGQRFTDEIVRTANMLDI